MTAIAIRVRADLRRRWLGWLALAVLIGLLAGAVTAIAAGARRTDTAYPRLVEATNTPDFVVADVSTAPGFANFSSASVAALPLVRSATRLVGYVSLDPTDLELIAPADDAAELAQWGRKVLRVEHPRRGRATR